MQAHNDSDLQNLSNLRTNQVNAQHCVCLGTNNYFDEALEITVCQ